MCPLMQESDRNLFIFSKPMKILSLISGLISLVLSVILLGPNHHRLMYPYRFIAIIGLTQTSFAWYVLSRVDLCTHGDLAVTMVQNTLVVKGSYMSKLLNGWWLTDISKYAIIG